MNGGGGGRGEGRGEGGERRWRDGVGERARTRSKVADAVFTSNIYLGHLLSYLLK